MINSANVLFVNFPRQSHVLWAFQVIALKKFGKKVCTITQIIQ